MNTATLNLIPKLAKIMTITIAFVQALAIATMSAGNAPMRFVSITILSSVMLMCLYFTSNHFARRAFDYNIKLIYDIAKEQATAEQPCMGCSKESVYESHNGMAVDHIALANIKHYLYVKLAELGFSTEAIITVQHYACLLADGLLDEQTPPSTIPRLDSVSQLDLKHLTWNVAQVVNVPALDAAAFAHTAFASWFDNTTIATTRRTLRETRFGRNRIALLDYGTILDMRTNKERVFADKKEEALSNQ